MEKISRRDFLRGGAAMAACFAASGVSALLSGCEGKTQPPAATVVPSTPPTPTMTPVPTFAPDAVLYETTVGTTNCWSGPDMPEDGFLGVIPQGVQSEFVREEGEYSLIRLPGGMEVYCRSWMLDPVDQQEKEERDLKELQRPYQEKH